MYPIKWVLIPLLLLLYPVVYLWISGDTGGEHVHPTVFAGEHRQRRGSQLTLIRMTKDEKGLSFFKGLLL
jgi:hypothetical protein